MTLFELLILYLPLIQQAMLVKMQEHPDLGVWCSKDSEIEFYDLERFAKALIDDKEREEQTVLVVYPFRVNEAVLSMEASGLKELGGDSLGVEVFDDDTNKEMQGINNVNNSNGETSDLLTIRDEDIERLCPGQFLNDTLVDFFMRW